MKKLLRFIGFLGVVLGMVLGARAEAENLYVPSGSYTTIQETVNAATPGDTISVSA